VTDDLLSSATDALRETPVDADGAATRLRVRRSLEATHRGRRQLVGFLTGTGILLAGTMSWAFATGRAEAVWRAILDPAPVREVREERAEAQPPAPTLAPAPRAPRQRVATEPPAPAPELRVEEPAPAPSPSPAPQPAPPAPAPQPAPRVEQPPPLAPAPPPRAVTARPIEALYRRAHELHFHGTDHAAAIAAWEAYLAAEPMGRFVAEARYNRALLLIRVGRYTEARAALAPYARGEIAGGYRGAEATRLIERLPERDRGSP
jgi:hypothetical protein